MSTKPSNATTYSLRFTPTPRKDETYLTEHEFDTLFKASGEKDRTRLIHVALRHYAESIQGQAELRNKELENPSKRQFYELLQGHLPELLIEKALAEYAKNDAAHLEDHAINVVLHAAEIIDRFPELQKDRAVILVGALLHDTKCHVNRDKHHVLGALAVYREYIQAHPMTLAMYSTKMISQIEECVLEHRASWKHKRSHNASEAVAAADRGKPDLYGYMRRAVRFRYAQLDAGTNVTNTVKSTIVQDSIIHMREKFGDDGYAWATMPHYTLLMYENEIAEMKLALTASNKDLLVTAFDQFDNWVA